MANEVRIRDNTPDVVKKISGLSGRTLEAFSDKCVEIIKDSDSTPEDSGEHRRNISNDFFGINKKVAARVFSQSGYGGYLEFGTSRMAARPHFRPGVMQAIKEFDDDKAWGE